MDRKVIKCFVAPSSVPPQPQTKIERFGYSIGQSGEVNVTVQANPMPQFIWRVGDVEIRAGTTDKTERLQTNSPVDLVSFNYY